MDSTSCAMNPSVFSDLSLWYFQLYSTGLSRMSVLRPSSNVVMFFLSRSSDEQVMVPPSTRVHPVALALLNLAMMPVPEARTSRAYCGEVVPMPTLPPKIEESAYEV